MKQWLDKRLLISLVEGHMLGTTVKLNHEDCPAGTDTRERLYITLRNDGTILGYCHNCGSRGFVKHDGVTNIHSGVHTPLCDDPPQFNVDEALAQSSTYPITRYLGFTYIEPIKEFMDKYGISNEWAEKDMWRYGAWQGLFVLVFPYYKKDGEPDTMTGCQVRHMLDKEELKKRGLPKIKTYGIIAPHIFNPNDSPTVVVCEDRVSGVKLAQAGYAACVMNGSSSISGPDAHALAMMFDRIVVWYDNDNVAVTKHAEQTKVVCELFTSNVQRIHTLYDPKKYTEKQIEDVLL